MSTISNATARWLPETDSDREVILCELGAILRSHHFRNSKRYPAFLKYVVDKTLNGQADQLKERTLGVEVFDRAADYDTNADPVVRFTASEVRKRIAQFYHDASQNSQLQIDLPLGSYVPEFTMKPPTSEPMSGAPAHTGFEADLEPSSQHFQDEIVSLQNPTQHSLKTLFTRPFWQWAVIFLLSLAPLAGAFALHRMSAIDATDKMWRPLLSSSGPVQIVIGKGLHEVRAPADPAHELLAGQLHGAYNRVSVCDAVAVSRIAAVLGSHAKPYEIKEADLTSLQDIRQRSVVLIGAYNNLWTMRLLEPLRFHFVTDGHSVRIVDSKDPESSNWAVDYSKSNSPTIYDYAILSRYTDAVTKSNVLIVAGIGAYGTEAASEAVASTSDLNRLLADMPKGWENKNFELVVRTAIINGEAGPATLISSTAW